MQSSDTLFQQKHELWLALLFGSFSLPDEEIADLLYDFAMIEYRHLNWLGGRLAAEGKAFDYEKDEIDYRAETTHALFAKLKLQIEMMGRAYPDPEDAMYARFRSDEDYFVRKLESLMADPQADAEITAYDKHRTLPGYTLDKTQTDALTLFLFEESYKEYELILVYTYANFFADSKRLSNIFIDLIYESHFHLKSFARMMEKMGILTVPRTIMERVYKFEDLEQFLIDGIKEEEGAKEECVKLAEMVGHDALRDFFFFINNQENYHIALMEQALDFLRSRA